MPQFHMDAREAGHCDLPIFTQEAAWNPEPVVIFM